MHSKLSISLILVNGPWTCTPPLKNSTPFLHRPRIAPKSLLPTADFQRCPIRTPALCRTATGLLFSTHDGENSFSAWLHCPRWRHSPPAERASARLPGKRAAPNRDESFRRARAHPQQSPGRALSHCCASQREPGRGKPGARRSRPPLALRQARLSCVIGLTTVPRGRCALRTHDRTGTPRARGFRPKPFLGLLSARICLSG